MSSTEMRTLNASDSPTEMVAGPAEYWEIARPLNAEGCSQGSGEGSGLKCTPRALNRTTSDMELTHAQFTYLHGMHQACPLPDKPLPAWPVQYVRTIDANLDGLSWKSALCSPAITPWMGRGTKRKAGREKSRPPRTPETRLPETINWDCAGSTPPNHLHPCSGAQDVPQSIPPWPGGPAIYSTHCVEHDPGGEEVTSYEIGHSVFRDGDCNSCPQANSWLAHDSCLGSPSEMGGASTAIDEAHIAATGDATICSWPTAYGIFDGPAGRSPLLPPPYDATGTNSGLGSIGFLDRPGPYIHDPTSGVTSPHGGDVDPSHPLSQQPDVAPCASPIVPAAAALSQPRLMAWAPVNAGHLATNSISVQTPQQSVGDPELPSLHTAPEVGSQEGSSGLLGWPAEEVWDECRRSIPCSSVDGTPVPLWGTTPSRADVNRLLDELQGVQRMTAFTINLVSAWLRSRFHTEDLQVMSVPWDQMTQHDSPIPSPSPKVLLIPMYTQTDCALLEVHLNAKVIVHYSFSTAPAASNAQLVASSRRGRVCAACRAVTGPIAPQLSVTSHPGPDWQTEHRPMHSAANPGITLSWFLHERAAGREVRHDPPKDFPLRLAQSLTRDLVRDQAPLCPGVNTNGASPRAAARQRWLSFAGRCMDPTALVVTWEQIAQIPVAGQPMGGEQADRLMQLVFNIASPATLIGVKHQLLRLRARDDESPHAFTRTVTGVFEAGLWHRTNEQASRVGLALTCWSVHQHRRRRQDDGCADPTGQTVTDIFHHLPKARRDRRLVEGKVREWSKRAWPWNQLIRAARGSPNILCFLPQGTNCFRGQEGICMTEYRTLRKVQFVVMEQLLQQYRPQLLGSVPANFFEIFLYNHAPPYRFAIEQWTDEEILREPVDSTKFDRAFEAIGS